jgi:hypothetical protein
MDLELNYTIKNNRQVITIISNKSIGIKILDNFKENLDNERLLQTQDIELIRNLISFINKEFNIYNYLESLELKTMIDNINNIDYLSIEVC